MLYFIPTKKWHDQRLELLRKYSDDSMDVEPGLIIYEEYTSFDLKTATNVFIEYIETLTWTLKAICRVQQEARITILSDSCTLKEQIQPCNMHTDLEILLEGWKSSNNPVSEFRDLVKLFAVIFSKTAYVIHTRISELDLAMHVSSTDASASHLVNMSKQNITHLLIHLEQLLRFLDGEIKRQQTTVEELATQNQDSEMFQKCGSDNETVQKLKANIEALDTIKRRANDATWRIGTLLNSQNLWRKSMTAAVDVQIYFFAWNTFLMLAMYFYPLYVYSALFYLMLFICRIYKRFIGDPVYLRSTYIFSFLQTTTAENEMKHRNRKRARNKHRRIRKM